MSYIDTRSGIKDYLTKKSLQGTGYTNYQEMYSNLYKPQMEAEAGALETQYKYDISSAYTNHINSLMGIKNSAIASDLYKKRAEQASKQNYLAQYGQTSSAYGQNLYNLYSDYSSKISKGVQESEKIIAEKTSKMEKFMPAMWNALGEALKPYGMEGILTMDEEGENYLPTTETWNLLFENYGNQGEMKLSERGQKILAQALSGSNMLNAITKYDSDLLADWGELGRDFTDMFRGDYNYLGSSSGDFIEEELLGTKESIEERVYPKNKDDYDLALKGLRLSSSSDAQQKKLYDILESDNQKELKNFIEQYKKDNNLTDQEYEQRMADISSGKIKKPSNIDLALSSLDRHVQTVSSYEGYTTSNKSKSDWFFWDLGSGRNNDTTHLYINETKYEADTHDFDDPKGDLKKILNTMSTGSANISPDTGNEGGLINTRIDSEGDMANRLVVYKNNMYVYTKKGWKILDFNSSDKSEIIKAWMGRSQPKG